MKKIELEIVALSHSITQSHSYAVVLGEAGGGTRRLPIVIGGFSYHKILKNNFLIEADSEIGRSLIACDIIL